MEFSSDPNFSLDGFLSGLRRHDPKVAAEIECGLDRPFSEYMGGLYHSATSDCSRPRTHARDLFVSRYRDEVAQPLSNEHAVEACAELLRHNTLQTGPHAQLLIDPYFFYTTIGSYIGLRSEGLRYYPSFTCTSNKLETRKGVGAAHLNIAGQPINVLGLSRSKMLNTSLVAAREGYSFVFHGKENVPSNAKHEFDILHGLTGDVSSESAYACFETANHKLWNRWDPDNLVHPVFLDDRFYANLVADHLDDPDSLLRRIYSSPSKVVKLLSKMKSYASGPSGSMFAYGTDLFWGIGREKIYELRYDSGILVKPTGSPVEPIRFDPSEISDRLRTGDIIPDVLTIFIVTCFLPGFRCLGGFFQVSYLPEFQDVFLSSLDYTKDEERAMGQTLQTENLSAWGMHVLEEPDDVMALISDVGSDDLFRKLEQRYASRTLRHVTRNLELFRTHQRWQQLIVAAEERRSA